MTRVRTKVRARSGPRSELGSGLELGPRSGLGLGTGSKLELGARSGLGSGPGSGHTFQPGEAVPGLAVSLEVLQPNW